MGSSGNHAQRTCYLFFPPFKLIQPFPSFLNIVLLLQTTLNPPLLSKANLRCYNFSLWTIRTGECDNTFDEHENRVWTLSVNSTETFFASGRLYYLSPFYSSFSFINIIIIFFISSSSSSSPSLSSSSSLLLRIGFYALPQVEVMER